jgi:hypothetical protein
MERRKITVEIDITEMPVIPFGAWICTQTFHDPNTGEELGHLATDITTGNYIIQLCDNKDAAWVIDKEQNAKIFTAILLQSEQPPITIDQTDLDEVYRDFMGDKL